MPSRWAFEALTVSLFTENEFQKHFYKVDKINSDVSFKLNFLLPKISSILDECKTILITTNDDEKLKENFLLVDNSIQYFLLDIPGIKTKVGSIESAPYDKKITKLENLFEYIKLFYSEYLDKALYKKDEITQRLVNEKGGAAEFIKFKEKHYNESVANMALNNDDWEKLFVQNNIYVRK